MDKKVHVVVAKTVHKKQPCAILEAWLRKLATDQHGNVRLGMNINKRVGTGRLYTNRRAAGACGGLGAVSISASGTAVGGGAGTSSVAVGATYRRLHTQFIACRKRRRCLYTVMMLLSVYVHFCVHVY